MLGANPASEIPIPVVEEALRLTLPDAGVVVIHAALGVAIQFKGLAQVPLAVMAACWAARFAWPATPVKVRAEAAAIVQGGCTLKLTGILCGLPMAEEPVLAVPVMVTVPV